MLRTCTIALPALLLAVPAAAQPSSLVDRSALGALDDGTMVLGEYTATSTGINTGFGGIIGAGTTYGVEADIFGFLVLGLSGGPGAAACPNDVIVVYIDSIPGGFTSTTGFTDNADPHRAAVSAMGTINPTHADLTFAAGFEADFAIAVNTTDALLFDLEAGASHIYLAGLQATPETSGWTAGCDHELSGLSLADLGIAPGDSFDYLVTLLDPANAGGAFRSDEFHGVAQTTVSGNPGIAPLTLAAGDLNTFDSVLVLINEVDADQGGTDTTELIELYDGGAGDVDLTGLAVVLFDGASDQSYRAIDLDGLFTDNDGFFVLGDSALPAEDFTLGTSDQLEDGADAVTLYLADASSFPNGTAATAVSGLVDALVYGTSDATDATLIAALTPGEPQIDEDDNGTAATDSSGRCGGGALETSGYLVTLATPGAQNICSLCGNGTIDAGEECDDGSGNSDTQPNACRTTCLLPSCGDGTIDSNEMCDDGLANSDTEPDACRSFCVDAFCSDGVIDTGEECDDGAGNSNELANACRNGCVLPTCGDGVTDDRELCDDGDGNSNLEPDACRTTCEPARCGDGVTDMEEACDDGPANSNTTPDACRVACTAPVCGDAVVDTGESCDQGMSNGFGSCTTTCTIATEQPPPPPPPSEEGCSCSAVGTSRVSLGWLLLALPWLRRRGSGETARGPSPACALRGDKLNAPATDATSARAS